MKIEHRLRGPSPTLTSGGGSSPIFLTDGQRDSVPGVATPAMLRAEARRLLAELSLCASASAGGIRPATSHSRPSSAPPRHVDDVVGHYAQRFRAAPTRDALERELQDARHELALLKARPDADVKTETLTELEVRIVEHGEGFDVLAVSIATRASETIVRRARLRAGRDATWGHPLPDELVNGAPMRFAQGLVAAGYPVRVAATLANVPKSTLFDHLRAS